MDISVFFRYLLVAFFLVLQGCQNLLHGTFDRLEQYMAQGSGAVMKLDTKAIQDTIEWSAKNAEELQKQAQSGAITLQRVQSGASKIMQGVNDIKQAVQ